MNLAHLVLQPRRFFDDRTDSINWAWPLTGFYLFAFATFFQRFVIHEYRMPYWLVVFVVAWAPAFLGAVGFFVLFVLLWYWPASKILGTAQPFVRSTKIIGVSLLPPGALFSASLLVLATVKGNGAAAPYQLLVVIVHAVSGLWALALIVLAASVSNKFTAVKTTVFVLWFAVLAILLGVFLYAVNGKG